MKIACGFEMLYQEEKSSMARQRGSEGTKIQIDRSGNDKNKDHDLKTPAPSSSHLSQNQAYLKYLVALMESGYFQGETTGSLLYNKLEARAKIYWEDMQEDRAAKGDNLAEKVDDLVEKASKQALSPSGNLQEDSDSWLYIDETRLEEMLNGKPDRAPEGEAAENLSQEEREEKMAQEQAQRLQGMADKFSTFLSGEGDIEGAMFEDEAFSDDDEDSDAEEGDDMVAGPSMPAEDKQKRLEKLVPGISDGEWGSAAANEARLAAKRKDDAQKASGKMQPEHAEALKDAGKSAGPSKADMQSAGLTPFQKYDGDDSGDELFDEEKASEQQEATSKPRLLDTTTMEDLSDEEDAQLDFGEGERDDFLKFAREALGLTEAQYADILRSREKRGAFVPETRSTRSDVNDLPHKKVPTAAAPTKSDEASKFSVDKPVSAPKQQPNSRLDSFEALMAAMDTELSKSRQGTQSIPTGSQPKAAHPEHMAIDDEDPASDDEDFDYADLDAELVAALKRDESESAPADYTMIKNFLESFKSQNGTAGPVSNIFGRLDKDFSMPRDK